MGTIRPAVPTNYSGDYTKTNEMIGACRKYGGTGVVPKRFW